MGISAFVRWTNSPVESPNGVELIQQRVQELFGSTVARKPFSAVLRTHRPHGTNTGSATSLLTTVQYPRSVEARNVTLTVEQKDGQWSVEVLPCADLIPSLTAKKSVYLQPPKVVQEGEFSNVANMTAAASAPSIKRPPAAAQMTPGTTLHLEGISLEIALGGIGLASGVEWIVRILAVGTAANEKGVIVEVEYPPLSTLPSNDGDHMGLLKATLQSILPAHAIQPLPTTSFPEYPSSDWDQPWNERWVGQERLRRSTWMLVRCLREEGVI